MQNFSESQNSNSDSSKKRQRPQHINDVFNEFTKWLSQTDYLRTKDAFDVLPQYYANANYQLRLAAIFCIPIHLLPKMSYEERVEHWAANVIHHFGRAVSHDAYRRWQHDIRPVNDDTIVDQIRARLFFTELHNLMRLWGRLGVNLISDLFHKVWWLLKEGTVSEWSSEEEETNSAPFRQAYAVERNEVNKVQLIDRGVCRPLVPDTKVRNILAVNHKITKAGNKITIERMEASYVAVKANGFVEEFTTFELNWNPVTDRVPYPKEEGSTTKSTSLMLGKRPLSMEHLVDWYTVSAEPENVNPQMRQGSNRGKHR
jgi:hypothetical protein